MSLAEVRSCHEGPINSQLPIGWGEDFIHQLTGDQKGQENLMSCMHPDKTHNHLAAERSN